MATARRYAWKFKPVETLFCDYTTGNGINSAGAPLKPLIGGRRTKPALVDLLNTAAHHGCDRVFLSGKLPTTSQGRPHWLLTPTEGWVVDDTHGHFIQDNRPPTGRFVRRSDGLRVEVRTAAEWFGTNDVSPNVAREALELTASLLRTDVQDPYLGKTPTSTGLNFWVATSPRDFTPEPLDDDIARQIRATTGQHRTEHLAAGPGRCDCGDCPPLITDKEIPRFTYIDGRFMYSALCREVGAGPAKRLTAAETVDYFGGANGRYNKGRALIRFTVPEHWDTLGLAPVPRDDGQWHYPCRPGATHTTWVDAVELDIIAQAWDVEILEGIALTKTRALDNFANRLLVARDKALALDADPILIDTVGAALRSILLQTIGGFHSTGRNSTIVVESARDVPPEYAASLRNYGELFTYTKPFDDSSNAWSFHPEYSSQVWARERARMLQAPTAKFVQNGREENRWGALSLDPHTLIGLNGDALYTTEIPRAALAAEAGGGDDGKPGRLRLKGIIDGPLTTPRSTEERNRLRARAEALGTPDEVTPTDG